ncbi:hypothetical protein D030_1614B, partial [Vibrio parahaemolyticus AQ3810]
RVAGAHFWWRHGREPFSMRR